MIGAPKGDTSALQPGVTKGGAVFRCEILDDDRCYMIPFDSKGKSFLLFIIITYLHHNGVRFTIEIKWMALLVQHIHAGIHGSHTTNQMKL